MIAPDVAADLEAEEPWRVARALGLIAGAKCFALWGIRASAHDGRWVCECVGGGRGDCKKSQPGKHPRKGGWQDAATADPEQLTRFSQMYPRANVAIRTGGPSGIVIVDVDGETGLASLEAAGERLGPLPETVRSRSGREGVGFHLWFALEPGAPVPRNSAGKLGPGIDVRGEGGYALTPGSLHKSGRRYAWEASPAVVAFAQLPQAWLDALETPAPAQLTPRASSPSRRLPGAAGRHAAGSRYIGDGEGRGGYNAPIYARACQYFAAQPDAPAEPLISALLEAVAAAPKAPGRDASRYLAEGYLREQAERARAFVQATRQ